jgi:hypothetical protein
MEVIEELGRPRARPTGLAAKAIDRPMARDREEPARERAGGRVERGRSSPKRHERVLRDFGCRLAVAEEADERAEDQAAVAVVGELEGTFVTRCDPPNQHSVIRLALTFAHPQIMP